MRDRHDGAVTDDVWRYFRTGSEADRSLQVYRRPGSAAEPDASLGLDPDLERLDVSGTWGRVTPRPDDLIPVAEAEAEQAIDFLTSQRLVAPYADRSGRSGSDGGEAERRMRLLFMIAIALLGLVLLAIWTGLV